MQIDLRASLKLLVPFVLLPGCTSTLDFDATSAGGGSANGEFDLAAAEAFSCDAHRDATFCDDFDGPGVEEHWERVLAPNEDVGVLENDNTTALSGTHSLLAIMNEGPTGGYVAVTALKGFEDAHDEEAPYLMTVDFDMRVETTDTLKDRYATVFQVLSGKDDTQGLNQLVLSLGSRGNDVGSWFREGWAVNGNYLDDSHDFKSEPTVSEWTHVSFTLDATNPGGEGNRVKLVVSGVVLYNGVLTWDLQKEGPRIELGVPWVKGDGEDKTWRVRYENVLVNVTQK